jgi:catechol 2,3-dioxygenase-like lactoylglutathione lyase family enzyme
MLDHLSLGVSDLQRAIRFYDAVFAPFGYVRLWTEDKAAGYGPAGGQDKLALFEQDAPIGPVPTGFHLAFTATTREAVDAFHAAGLVAGGTDCGAPGLRAHYAPTYYAAFLADPDGWKVEAVNQ